MATRREAEGRTAGTILADSRGARKRFGFGGAPQTPIKSAPKFTDQWFIEFTNTTGSVNNISAQAQSVSPITIQTTTQPVDRYGRREYISTRVDFPEVTVTFYDTVDGKTMIFAKDIYAKFFKNASLGVDGEVMHETIEDINSGRKFPAGSSLASHKHFDKVTVYHFFGSFTTGDGTIQRIVLVNPTVTSITFSESDYSQSSLRTISITLQPENVVFGTPSKNPSVPLWMQEGLEFILEDFDVSKMSEFEKKIIEDLKLQQLQMNTDNNSIVTTSANIQEQEQALEDLSKYYQELRRIENDPNSTDEDVANARNNFQQIRSNSPILTANPAGGGNINPQPSIESRDVSPEAQRRRANELRDRLTRPSETPNVDNVDANKNQIGSDLPTSSDIAERVKDAIIESVVLNNEINLEELANSIANLESNGIIPGIGEDDTSINGLSGDDTKDSIIRNANEIPTDPPVTPAPVEEDTQNSDRQNKQDKIETVKKSAEDTRVERRIGGEPYVPGQVMSDNQMAAVEVSLAMGNPVEEQVMEDYDRSRVDRLEKRRMQIDNTLTEIEDQGIPPERQEEYDNLVNELEENGRTLIEMGAMSQVEVEF